MTAVSGNGGWLVSIMSRRRWPCALTVATLLTGMAYSLAWGPVIRHHSVWLYPGDIWATLRGAHYVAWGDLGDVYGSHSFLVSFPGILIVLAPVSMLASVLGLSEGFPVPVAHPTAWLVVGPAILMLTAIPLLGLDALAEARGMTARRRRSLVCAEAAVLWIVVAYWGHPEDALALGLLAYALAAVLEQRPRACGWLMGVAVVMQPLSLLVLPALLASVAPRARAGLTLRTVGPASTLLAILLAADLPDTWRALTSQPNYPTVNHPTPWVWLSPSLGPKVVAAGPARTLCVAAALGVGLWVWLRRRRGRAVDLAWAATLALAARCVFEPVVVPYYVTPAVALALLTAFELGRVRATLAAGLGLAVTAIVFQHAGPVRWWLQLVALLAGLLVCARPRRPGEPGLVEARPGDGASHRILATV